MKRTYLKIIIFLLVFLVGGLGCVKQSKNSDSGLTSITVGSGELAKAIDNKIKSSKGLYDESLKIVGAKVVIVGYNKNTKKIEFECNDPLQSETQPADCIINTKPPKGKDTKVPPGPPPEANPKDVHGGKNPPQGGEPPRDMPPPEQGPKPGKPGAPLDQKPNPDLKYNPLKTEIKQGDSDSSVSLSAMSLKYNGNLEYYGILQLYCTTSNIKDPALCIQNKDAEINIKNVGEPSKDGKVLTIKIPLQWTKSFGNEDGTDTPIDNLTAEGKIGENQVDVEITPTVEEDNSTTKGSND